MGLQPRCSHLPDFVVFVCFVVKNEKPRRGGIRTGFESGAEHRIRTDDPCFTKALLYQLS